MKLKFRPVCYILIFVVGWWVASLLAPLCYAQGPADKSGVTPNTISLPSGPGSIEGLGESFQPTLNTGTAKYRIGLTVPPGTAGHTPSLALDYDGGGSNGPLGFGWGMDIPFIQRQTDKGIPRYVDGNNNRDDDRDGTTDEPDEIDIFINNLKEELVPTAEGYYFCENEGAFIRYQRVEDHWEGAMPDGTLREFGLTPDARIRDADTGRVFRWMLERVTDTNGNTIVYTYEPFPGEHNTNQRYLAKIEYGPGGPPWANLHFIVFKYEPRPDWFEDGRAGFIIRTGKRLKEIIVGTQGVSLAGHASGDFNQDGQPDYLNRKYVLAYETPTHASLLTSVTWVGADGLTTFPPVNLGYTLFDPPDTVSARDQVIGSVNTPFQVMDNGLVDLVDLNGDALPDILKTQQYRGAHTASLNLGETDNGSGKVISWGDTTPVTSTDGLAWNINLRNSSRAVAHLADMNADGQADLVYKSSVGDVYYFQNGANTDWGPRLKMNVTDSAPPSPFGQSNVKTADLDFNKHMDIIQSISVGSGAYYRIWFNLGNRQFSKSTTVSQEDGVMLSASGVHIADFNGDRVPDIIRIRPTRLQVTAGLGYGHFAPMKPITLTDYTFDDAMIKKVRLQDISGDGLVDLVIERAAPGQLWYWINQGNYTLTKRRKITGMPTTYGLNPEIRWADLNGNGTTDLVYADSRADPTIQTIDIGRLIGAVPSPNLLISIDNGIGRKTTIQYATSTRFLLEDLAEGHTWPHPLPFPVNVVAEITVDDSMGNQYATEFSYHDGYYDGEAKEFRGFAAVEKRDVGDVTAPDLIMAYTFDTGAIEEALKGKPLQLEAQNAVGEIFYREAYVWRTRNLSHSANGDGRKVTFPFQQAKTRDILEKGNGLPVQLKWEYEYDNYGNMTRQEEYGRMDAGWDDERVTQISYTAGYPSGQSAWLLNKVVEQTTQDENGMLVAQTRNYYDQSLVPGVVTKGNLTRVEDWVAGGKFIVSARNDYDAYGNIVTTYDPLYDAEPGHYRDLIYDDRFYTYPVQELIHTGKITPATLTFAAAYDYGFGVITASTEFNGFTTDYDYDTFARLTSITKPPDRDHTIEFDYLLAQALADGQLINWVETRQRDGSADDGFLYSRTFYDGLGRKLQTRSEAENGQVVVEEAITFNARQAERDKFLPYFATGFDYALPDEDLPHTTQYYDPLERAIRTVNPDDSFATITYHPLAQVQYDEEDNTPTSLHSNTPKTLTYDGLERLVEVQEVNRVAGQPETYTTRYGYDPLGNLIRIADAQGNIKTMRYDALSRKMYMADPDRGEMTYSYDDVGNLIETVDAKNQIVRYTYDAANRPLTEQWMLADSTVITPVHYHYDSDLAELHRDAQNTLGQLSYVEDQAGAVYYSYDARGNIAGQIRRFSHEELEFVTRMAYDAMDRLVELTYPDGTVVTYEYNDQDLLERIPGFVADVDYIASGQQERAVYPNGVVTTYQYDQRLRLEHLLTRRNQTTLQDLTYSFDNTSNIEAIADGRPERTAANDQTQSYGYDALYRLTNATGTYGQIDYAYNSIGNMTRKTSTAADPRLNLGEMGYGQNGAGPHALTSAGGVTYSYDANGNLSHKDGTTYTWDHRDRLVAVDDGDTHSTYIYDAAGQRTHQVVSRNGVVTTTLYPAQYAEVRGDKLVQYVFAGQQRLAEFSTIFDPAKLISGFAGSAPANSPVPTERLWYLTDHLGGTSLQVDENGQTMSELFYYPYGLTRYEMNGGQVRYGFTGKELDVTGLHYYGARYYNAATGRFISTDFLYVERSEKGLENPFTVNLYAYAVNNPIRFSDLEGQDIVDKVDVSVSIVDFAAEAIQSAVTSKGLAWKGAASFGLTVASKIAEMMGAPSWSSDLLGNAGSVVTILSYVGTETAVAAGTEAMVAAGVTPAGAVVAAGAGGYAVGSLLNYVADKTYGNHMVDTILPGVGMIHYNRWLFEKGYYLFEEHILEVPQEGYPKLSPEDWRSIHKIERTNYPTPVYDSRAGGFIPGE